MAFRRNYKRGRRPAGFRRRGAPLARVKRTWVQSLLLDPCDAQLIPLCSDTENPCCTTRWEQVILDNAVLQSQFSDRARVVRIVGDVVIGFDPHLGSDHADNYNRLTASIGSLFVQLIKRPISGSGNAELPPEIWDSTSVIEGYSESKALKTWWHFWNPFDTFGITQANPSGSLTTSGLKHKFTECTTGVDAALYGSLSAGTGTIGATPESTCTTGGAQTPLLLKADCVPCGSLDFGQLQSDGVKLGVPHSWKFHLDVKKRIALREDEQLNLDFQFRSPFSALFTGGNMVMLMGGIKTLLEF